MKKKKLTTKERVDRLLKEGVNNPKKWAAVHDYKEPEGTVRSWKTEYERLRKHHLEETFFLFDMLREMSNRLNPPPPSPKVGDKVIAPWWEYKNGKAVKTASLNGTIVEINGAYHYIEVKGRGTFELYPNEFEVVK